MARKNVDSLFFKAESLESPMPNVNPRGLVKGVWFPAFSILMTLGYLDQSYPDRSHPDSEYFNALLDYLHDYFPEVSVFIGNATPNSMGICIINKYSSISSNSCSGIFINNSAQVFSFGRTTSPDRYYWNRIPDMDEIRALLDQLNLSNSDIMQSIDNQQLMGGGWNELRSWRLCCHRSAERRAA